MSRECRNTAKNKISPGAACGRRAAVVMEFIYCIIKSFTSVEIPSILDSLHLTENECGSVNKMTEYTIIGVAGGSGSGKSTFTNRITIILTRLRPTF